MEKKFSTVSEIGTKVYRILIDIHKIPLFKMKSYIQVCIPITTTIFYIGKNHEIRNIKKAQEKKLTSSLDTFVGWSNLFFTFHRVCLFDILA